MLGPITKNGTVISFLLCFWTLSMARTVLGLNPGRGKKYFLPHNFEMGSGAHPAFNEFPTREFFNGVNCPSVGLTIYPHLMKKFRINGAMPLLPHMPS
jgi:hypothetical protein